MNEDAIITTIIITTIVVTTIIVICYYISLTIKSMTKNASNNIIFIGGRGIIVVVLFKHYYAMYCDHITHLNNRKNVHI